MASTTSHGQGTINFNTRVVLDHVNLRVVSRFDNYAATSPPFVAQLYGGPAGTPASQLVPIGSPVPFRSGNAAGWVDAGIVTVPGVPGGTRATLQLRAWDATSYSSYKEAQRLCGIFGESPTWTAPPIRRPHR